MGTPWFMYNVTKGFSDPSHGNHDGWDFGAPSRTPLVSLTGGQVTQHTGWYPWGGEIDIKGGVLGPGVTETFAHADAINVRAGDTILPGQQVGLSGGENLPAQFSSGPHVHYSLFGGAPWDNTKAIDPSSWIGNVKKNFGLGSGLGSTGADANNLPGVQAIADAIDGAYKGAEVSLSNTIKRAGWFIIGVLLIGLGLVVLMLAVGVKAGKVAAPYAEKAATVAAFV